ncbi:MAG: lamin tail domain-containing protein [Theionarchaea archaeon]|nr:lamin tail domain-containing protein [Theionarchaea archaeon]
MKKVWVLACVLMVQTVVAGQECMYPPAEGSENIVILRVNFSATSLNEEYIVLFNTGKSAVDISNWVVFNNYYEQYRHLPVDERRDPQVWKHVYKIPRGIVLEPKDWVRICSGVGKDNEMYLYRNLNTSWISDSGEIIYLMDDMCNIIHQFP